MRLTIIAPVTLRQGRNPHDFFCLSSVGDGLSSGAWLRLGARRSGGGKARKQCLHSGVVFPGRCQARWCSHAFPKGMHGPQLRFLASWGAPTPASFDAAPLGTYPQGRWLFLGAILSRLLHFLKPLLC